MRREYRLKKSREFSQVYRTGRAAYNRDFKIMGRANGLDHNRYGFSISKKFGKAFERNRIKRQLREIVWKNQERFPSSYDFIILPRQAAKNKAYVELEGSLFHCLHFWKGRGLVRQGGKKE